MVVSPLFLLFVLSTCGLSAFKNSSLPYVQEVALTSICSSAHRDDRWYLVEGESFS